MQFFNQIFLWVSNMFYQNIEAIAFAYLICGQYPPYTLTGKDSSFSQANQPNQLNFLSIKT